MINNRSQQPRFSRLFRPRTIDVEIFSKRVILPANQTQTVVYRHHANVHRLVVSTVKAVALRAKFV